MRCPRCDHIDDRVIDSRSSRDADIIRRRRECLGCGFRFTTYERIEIVVPTVVKRDGRREPFNREKVFAGLVRACEKRPIETERLRRIVDRIERQLGENLQSEVTSQQVGDLVMEELKALDGVAYLRFASVYQSFDDIGEFLAEAERVGRKTP